jgi:Fe-S-cluster containining protein
MERRYNPEAIRKQESIKVNQPSLQFGSKPFVIVNATVYFSGNCDECRPHCGAACCRAYGFVALTEAEAQSGNYAYKVASGDCDCDTCKRMLELSIRYILLKQPDGSCIYLDGARKCSIYENRTETCRRYSCVNIPFGLSPIS